MAPSTLTARLQIHYVSCVTIWHRFLGWHFLNVSFLSADYASGVTVDYAYSAEGIIYAYTLELRDDSSGSHGGFQMPPQYIRPTATETWNGIKAMAVAILNP